MTERLETMRMELRRGALSLAVLTALQNEQYGYSLRKTLLAANIDIEEGTLYPLIRRLESYGLLNSRWSEGEGRKRRYYKISNEGKTILATLEQEWKVLARSIKKMKEITI